MPSERTREREIDIRVILEKRRVLRREKEMFQSIKRRSDESKGRKLMHVAHGHAKYHIHFSGFFNIWVDNGLFYLGPLMCQAPPQIHTRIIILSA